MKLTKKQKKLNWKEMWKIIGICSGTVILVLGIIIAFFLGTYYTK